MAKGSYEHLLRKVAKNIRQYRELRGYTQEQVAELGNFNYRYYQKLESGTHSFNLRTLNRLAETLDVDVSELISGLK